MDDSADRPCVPVPVDDALAGTVPRFRFRERLVLVAFHDEWCRTDALHRHEHHCGRRLRATATGRLRELQRVAEDHGSRSFGGEFLPSLGADRRLRTHELRQFHRPRHRWFRFRLSRPTPVRHRRRLGDQPRAQAPRHLQPCGSRRSRPLAGPVGGWSRCLHLR